MSLNLNVFTFMKYWINIVNLTTGITLSEELPNADTRAQAQSLQHWLSKKQTTRPCRLQRPIIMLSCTQVGNPFCQEIPAERSLRKD